MKRILMAAMVALLAACDVSLPQPQEATPSEPQTSVVRLELVETFPVVDEPNHWVELNDAGTGLQEYTPSRPDGDWWDDRTGGKWDSDGRLWVNSETTTDDGVRIWNVYSQDRTHLFDVAVATILDATGDRVLMGTRNGAEEGYVNFHLLRFKK